MENKQFKGADLHAPRKRNRLPDFIAYPKKDQHGYFARLKQQYPHMAQYNNRQIASWIEDYCKQMADDVVTSRDGVLLPEGLGYVVVGACRVPDGTTRQNIDYKTSKELGEAVPHYNHHTDGYVAVIKYTNDIPRKRFTNHQLWAFKPCRKLSRAVSAEFKKGHYNRYRPFSKWVRITDIFRKQKPVKTNKRSHKAVQKNRRILEGYDECDFT